MADKIINIPPAKGTGIQVSSELNKFIGTAKPSNSPPVRLPKAQAKNY